MRIMSSASLRLEKFASGWSSASLTPRLPLFHFSVGGFMMYRRNDLNKKERAERVTLLGSSLEMACF